MKKTGLLLASLLLTFFYCSAQSKFTRSVIAASQMLDWRIAKQTADGGYIILASAIDTGNSLDPQNIFLVKLNLNGDTLWTNQINHINGSGDLSVNQIEEASDGFIISSYTHALGTGDILLVKTDTAGNFQWAKTYGSTYNDGPTSIKRTSDNGFILCGSEGSAADSKVAIIKINSFGDTAWTKDLSVQDIYSQYAFETSDGSIIVIGSFDYHKGFLCKLSPSGNLLWSRMVSSDGWLSQSATNAIETNDGGFVVVSTETYTNTSDVCKVDSAGNLVFKKRIVTGSSDFDSFNMCQLSDGRIKLVYAIQDMPYFLLQVVLDPTGNTIDAKSLPGIHSLWSRPELTSDEGVICINYFGKITKIDSAFNAECISAIPYTGLIEDTSSFSAITLTEGTISNWTITSLVLTNGDYISSRVEATCIPDASICLVTVDPTTQKNLIVWEKNTDTTFVDSYKIYKETAIANSYVVIGTVPVSQYSTFLDSASNPNVQADRYCITPLWNGYEKELTSSHKTIHLTINLGLYPNINLIWSDYFGFSYSSYIIWRGTAAGASIIATVPYGTNSYTDLAPPTNDTLYFIEVSHAPCNPSFRWSGSENYGGGNNQFSSFTSTLSNIVSKGSSIGIDEFNRTPEALAILPNPNAGSFQIAIPGEHLQKKNLTLSIYNSLGQLIQQKKVQVHEGKISVSLGKEAKGIYNAVLGISDKVYTGMIVVE